MSKTRELIATSIWTQRYSATSIGFETHLARAERTLKRSIILQKVRNIKLHINKGITSQPNAFTDAYPNAKNTNVFCNWNYLHFVWYKFLADIEEAFWIFLLLDVRGYVEFDKRKRNKQLIIIKLRKTQLAVAYSQLYRHNQHVVWTRNSRIQTLTNGHNKIQGRIIFTFRLVEFGDASTRHD